MISEFELKSVKKDLPEFRSGATVRVHQKIREGDKERVQIFEGVLIKIAGNSPFNKMITVRKVIDGIGVEKIYPVNSPNVAKIEIVKRSKVRRAKLYYLRGKEGSRVKLYEEKKKEHAKAQVRVASPAADRP